MNCEDLIAVARIANADPKPGRYRITTGGDGLESLKLPAPVWLHRPAYQGNDLKRILSSVRPHPRDDGEFRAAVLRSTRVTEKKRGYIDLKATRADGNAPINEELNGWWVCVERAHLAAGAKDDEFFVFQVLGLPVFAVDEQGKVAGAEPVGRVEGYLETGAHGVLEVRTGDGNEVLLPVVETYVHLDLAAGRIEVRDFEDFTQ